MIKIKDVAARAGVSVATVSRALNDVPTVAPELADRVRVAAAELDYRGNGAARSLRRRRSDAWALIVSDISDRALTSVARGVEDIAQNAGFSVVLCNSDGDPVKEARYLDIAEREQVSGVILSPNQQGSDTSRLHRAGIPVVAIENPLPGEVDAVVFGASHSAQLATEHLFEQGWLRPALITGADDEPATAEHAAGYLLAWDQASRPTVQSLLRHVRDDVDEVRSVVAALLATTKPPDTFVATSHAQVAGVLTELKAQGIEVGDDVGVVALGDSPWYSVVSPSVTAVANPAYAMGRRAGELMMARVGEAREARSTVRQVRLDPEIVVRASSLRDA